MSLVPYKRLKSHYSPYSRIRIISYFNANIAKRVLFAKFDILKGSVSRIVKRFKVQNKGIFSPSRGRPKILLEAQLIYIIDIIDR